MHHTKPISLFPCANLNIFNTCQVLLKHSIIGEVINYQLRKVDPRIKIILFIEFLLLFLLEKRFVFFTGQIHLPVDKKLESPFYQIPSKL